MSSVVMNMVKQLSINVELQVQHLSTPDSTEYCGSLLWKVASLNWRHLFFRCKQHLQLKKVIDVWHICVVYIYLLGHGIWDMVMWGEFGFSLIVEKVDILGLPQQYTERERDTERERGGGECFKYLCVCVCVCVWMRERERGVMCVCVCVCFLVVWNVCRVQESVTYKNMMDFII